MNPLDHQSEAASITLRGLLSLVMAFLVANQVLVSILSGLTLAALTGVSMAIQIRNSNRKDERDRVQAERDALAYELKERRAAERHAATLQSLRHQLDEEDLEEEQGE